MRKKCFTGLIAACVCCFVASVFAACGAATDFKAEFKENVKTDIQVNQCIDIEDYIVKVPNTTYKITFSYEDTVKKKDVVDELEGVTYFFKQTTDYIMEYTVTSGKKSKSAELEFNVYGLAPTLTIGVPVITYPKNTTVYLEALMENANPFYTPVNCKLQIQSVYYQRESVTLERTIEEGTSYERSLKDEETFTFDKEGSYLFTLAATSEYGTSTETIRVEILDQSSGNEDTLKNENGEAVIYNAEVDGNTVRMIRGAEAVSVSYMVLDGEYTEDDVFRFEFKGKNCPQIGLLTQEDETSVNPYGVYSGQGYLFSFEDNYTDRFSCWGPTKRAGSNLHNGREKEDWLHSGCFGRDDFEDDKYYSVEVRVHSGKEKKKGTEEYVDMTYLKVFIYELDGYNTDNENFSLIYKAAVGWEKRVGHPSSGKVILYGSLKDNICFKYYKPMTQVVDASTFNYDKTTKTLSWGAVEGALYHVSTDNVNYTQQSKTSYTLKDTSFVGAQAIYVKTATLGKPVYYNVLNYPENEDFDKVGVSGSVPSVRYSEDYKQITATISSAYVAGASRYENVNYIYTSKEYAAGSNYMRFEFKGNNPIGGVFFGVQGDFSANLSEVKGYGLELNYSLGGVRYLTASGTTVTGSSVKATSLIQGTYDKNKDKDQGFACLNYQYFNNNKDKDFVLIVGTSKIQDSNRYRLYAWIYEKNGTELTLLNKIETNNIDNAQLSPNGKIMVVSAQPYNRASEFKMWMPDTLENAQAALNSDYTVVGE